MVRSILFRILQYQLNHGLAGDSLASEMLWGGRLRMTGEYRAKPGAVSSLITVLIALAGLVQVTSAALIVIAAGSMAACSALFLARAALRSLAASREEAHLFTVNPAPSCLIGASYRIRRANDAFCTLFGLDRNEAIGAPCYAVMPGASCATSKCPLFRIVDGEERVEMEEEREAKEGKIVACGIQASPFFGPQGKIAGIIVNVDDIAERKRLENHLAHSATHDPLTDLPNRALFLDRLSQAIARTRRTGGFLATIFIDLDRFKEINDSLGHEAGDRLLQETARRIQSALRTTDSVARLGGDEFVVLVNEIAGVDNALEIARKILEAIRSPVVPVRDDGQGEEGPEEDREVAASIGIAVYPEDGEDGATLIRHADLAMYGAKKSAGERIQRYRPAQKGMLPEHDAAPAAIDHLRQTSTTKGPHPGISNGMMMLGPPRT